MNASDWISLPDTAFIRVFQDDVYPCSISDQVFGLIDAAYKSVGGHWHFQKAGDLPGSYDVWHVLCPQDPQGVLFGKSTPYGVKWAGVASVARFEVKQAVLAKLRQLLNENGNYVEASGILAKVLLRSAGCVVVNDRAAVQGLIGKPVLWTDGGWYRRTIHGHPALKIMLGRPLGAICCRAA